MAGQENVAQNMSTDKIEDLIKETVDYAIKEVLSKVYQGFCKNFIQSYINFVSQQLEVFKDIRELVEELQTMNEVEGDIPVETFDKILKIDNVCQKRLTVLQIAAKAGWPTGNQQEQSTY